MKKLQFILSFLMLMMITSTSYALVYEGGTKTITKIRVDGGGVSIALSPAPSNCNGGAQWRMHARVYADFPNYDAMVSSLLALKTSNTPIKGLWFLDGNITCDQSNILKLQLIEY